MSRGFTLIEMMVTLTIFTVILGIAYTALTLNDIYRDNVGIQIELYRKNKQIHDTIAQELALSTMSKVKTDADPCLQNSPCFQIPIGTDDNYDIIWGAGNAAQYWTSYWIHYKLDGTNLVREILKDNFSSVSQGIISSNVIATTFQFQTNAAVINTTIQKRTIEGRNISLSSQSEVYLRND